MLTVVLVEKACQFTGDFAGQEITPKSFSRQDGVSLPLLINDFDENVMSLPLARDGIAGESQEPRDLVAFLPVCREIFELVVEFQFSQIIHGGLTRLTVGGHTGGLGCTACFRIRDPFYDIELHDNSPMKCTENMGSLNRSSQETWNSGVQECLEIRKACLNPKSFFDLFYM